jgi:periplasmic divalent cation tolerance protein
MPDFILVQTSIDTKEAAQKLAGIIIENRLAACCWISGPITSIYWWKGQKEQAQEWVCSFKTRNELYNSLETAIKELHSYEVPEIVATPVVAGSQSFLEWIVSETKAGQ